MLSKRVVVLLCTLFCLLAIPPSGLYSQTAGTVNGLVADTTGAVVVGATVTLTDKATGFAQTMTTNDAGRYVFVDKDRKSTRLNSSHEWISYAVFCLKKKKKITQVAAKNETS